MGEMVAGEGDFGQREVGSGGRDGSPHSRGNGEGGGFVFPVVETNGWIWGRCGAMGGFHGGMVAGEEGISVGNAEVGSGEEGWVPAFARKRDWGEVGTAVAAFARTRLGEREGVFMGGMVARGVEGMGSPHSRGNGWGARERRGVGGHGGDGCEGGRDGSPHSRGNGEGGGICFFLWWNRRVDLGKAWGWGF